VDAPVGIFKRKTREWEGQVESYRSYKTYKTYTDRPSPALRLALSRRRPA
jgi:hypothetical protein